MSCRRYRHSAAPHRHSANPSRSKLHPRRGYHCFLGRSSPPARRHLQVSAGDSNSNNSDNNNNDSNHDSNSRNNSINNSNNEKYRTRTALATASARRSIVASPRLALLHSRYATRSHIRSAIVIALFFLLGTHRLLRRDVSASVSFCYRATLLCAAVDVLDFDSFCMIRARHRRSQLVSR